MYLFGIFSRKCHTESRANLVLKTVHVFPSPEIKYSENSTTAESPVPCCWKIIQIENQPWGEKNSSTGIDYEHLPCFAIL